jgi:hypothetical protein
MRLGWVTDIHLNFVPPLKRSQFYARVRAEKLDALLLGGGVWFSLIFLTVAEPDCHAELRAMALSNPEAEDDANYSHLLQLLV